MAARRAQQRMAAYVDGNTVRRAEPAERPEYQERRRRQETAPYVRSIYAETRRRR